MDGTRGVPGLWEFPGVPVGKAAGSSQRRAAIDALLDEGLGLGEWRKLMVERRSLGSAVHIFSHIHMTMHVETLILQVRFPSSVKVCVRACAAFTSVCVVVYMG